MTSKTIVVALCLFGAALARPQLDFVETTVEPVNPHPVYNYAFQVADDEAQTYIAKNEERDGDDLTGQYSYVDPLGSLIVVRYRAGPFGYTEEREVQENFVAIRSKPTATISTFTDRVVNQVAPVVSEVVTTEESSSTSEANDGDLVARIIAQLTPFIRQSVTSTLPLASSNQEQQQQTTTTRRIVARRRPAVANRPVVTRVVTSSAPVQTSSSSSAIQGIFGTGGANNIRFSAPEVNYNVDF